MYIVVDTCDRETGLYKAETPESAKKYIKEKMDKLIDLFPNCGHGYYDSDMSAWFNGPKFSYDFWIFKYDDMPYIEDIE